MPIAVSANAEAQVDGSAMLPSGSTKTAVFSRSIAVVGVLLSLSSSILIAAMLWTYQVRVDCVIAHLAGGLSGFFP